MDCKYGHKVLTRFRADMYYTQNCMTKISNNNYKINKSEILHKKIVRDGQFAYTQEETQRYDAGSTGFNMRNINRAQTIKANVHHKACSRKTTHHIRLFSRRLYAPRSELLAESILGKRFILPTYRRSLVFLAHGSRLKTQRHQITFHTHPSNQIGRAHV